MPRQLTLKLVGTGWLQQIQEILLMSSMAFGLHVYKVQVIIQGLTCMENKLTRTYQRCKSLKIMIPKLTVTSRIIMNKFLLLQLKSGLLPHNVTSLPQVHFEFNRGQKKTYQSQQLSPNSFSGSTMVHLDCTPQKPKEPYKPKRCKP